MTEILLINPAFRSEGNDWHLVLNNSLSIAYIAAYLNINFVPAEILVYDSPFSEIKFRAMLKERTPSLIGISCYDATYYYVKFLSSIIKEELPDTLIVLGGPSASYSDDFILKDAGSVDICVRGPGEFILEELISGLKSHCDNYSLEGISWRDKNGKIYRNADSKKFEKATYNSLDVIPSPYLTGLLSSEPNPGILTTRGCGNICSYCNGGGVYNRALRFYSNQRVLSEIDYIVKNFNSGWLRIQDADFAADPERSKQLCSDIASKDYDLDIYAMIRADKIDKELVASMKAAGIKMLYIGLESAVPAELDAVSKNPKCRSGERYGPEYVEKVEYAAHLIKEAGIDFAVNMMLGLPLQTHASAYTTLKFVENLNPDIYYQNTIQLFPGTDLFSGAGDYGIKKEPGTRGLPYRTLPPFDPASVILSDKVFSGNKFIEDNMLYELKRIFSRESRADTSDNNCFSSILLDDAGCLSKKTVRRFLPNMALSPVLISFTKDADAVISNNKLQGSLALLPFNTIIFIEKLEGPLYHLFSFSIPLWAKNTTCRGIKILFASANEFLKYISTMSADDIVFIKPDTPEKPMEKFQELSSTADNIINSEKALPSVRMEYECQWANGLCPAPFAGDLFIDQEGNSSSCRKQNVDVSYLISGRLEERRGCSSCPVNKKCSKCINTSPFTEEEFCSLRKVYDTMSIVSKLRFNDKIKRILKYRKYYDMFR